MAIAREAEPVGSLNEVREAGLEREDLLGIYRNMILTRGLEERGHILYRQGKIPGSFYTGRGNEAAAVGVASAMGPDDVGTPLHRDMGVHITRGVGPSARPMNWAKMRHGSTPRVMCTPMSRCSGVPTSSAPIADATPTAAASLPRPV